MASISLSETVHKWPNGFLVMRDKSRTALALVAGGSVDDFFVINVKAWHPKNIETMFPKALKVFENARYIDTQYASGVVVYFPRDFCNEESHPARCLYLSKNPNARHLMRRTSENVELLVDEIQNFKY